MYPVNQYTNIKPPTGRIGTVKFYNVKLGWGFISAIGSKKEYFVHFTSIENDSNFKKLENEQKVLFDVAVHHTYNKEQAVNVRAL